MNDRPPRRPPEKNVNRQRDREKPPIAAHVEVPPTQAEIVLPVVLLGLLAALLPRVKKRPQTPCPGCDPPRLRGWLAARELVGESGRARQDQPAQYDAEQPWRYNTTSGPTASATNSKLLNGVVSTAWPGAGGRRLKTPAAATPARATVKMPPIAPPFVQHELRFGHRIAVASRSNARQIGLQTRQDPVFLRPPLHPQAT